MDLSIRLVDYPKNLTVLTTVVSAIFTQSRAQAHTQAHPPPASHIATCLHIVVNIYPAKSEPSACIA